jgi:hypothetical protein
VFTLKGRENLNFKSITWIKFGLNLKLKLTFEIEFAFKLEIFEVFLKKMFRFPLLLDGGVRGFIFLRGL